MIYLDNAATSFPKPKSVIDEVSRCMRLYCGNPGRGSHRMALASAEKIYECRTEIASLFGSDHPENVCFMQNTTMALNLAIKGLLQEGDHVLISDMEHNAVYRPIYQLAQEGKITYDIFPSFVLDSKPSTARICTAIARLTKPKTRMLICTHASNICSASLPLAEIGAFCKRKGIYFVVDAAQSAGHLPIHLESMKIDALCAPGHKGLWGPQGSGFVFWGNDVVAKTIIEGGSGYHSLEGEMPPEAPERYEAGTLSTPAIAGLCAGVREVSKIGILEIAQREKHLTQRLYEMLSTINGVEFYAPHHHGGVLLFNVGTHSAEILGSELDRRGFCVRAGFHCAAIAHKTLQTPLSGAVRVSPGFFNKDSDMDAFYFAIKEILK